MEIRLPRPEDFDQIQEISKRYDFDLPEKFTRAVVVEQNNKIIAFAVVRDIPEALFYCNANKMSTIKSLDELVKEAASTCLARGQDQLYIFAIDEKFAKILETRYGFKRSPFVPMFKDLNNGQ